jgi:lysophospholipase L1-like esterase
VNDDETIDAHMRRLLPGRFRGACFEVVNLALGGYDSYQDYERMRVDGTWLKPDLVVINSGINDVRNAQFSNLTYPPDPRTLIWEPAMQPMREMSKHGLSLWHLAQHYSYLARIPGYALELWRHRQELHAIQVADADSSAIDYFEINVVRTTELALEQGAAIILSTPPSALSARNKPSDPPEKSYWIKDAGTTEEYRRRLATRMKEIAERLAVSGRRVSYVAHSLPVEQFLDDAHLTSDGNLTVARNLIETAMPFIQAKVNPDRGGMALCEAARGGFRSAVEN